MAHPYRPDIQHLSRAAQQFQTVLEILVGNFMLYDMDGVVSGINRLFEHSRILDDSLLALRYHNDSWGRTSWKRQNRYPGSNIDRSCAAINRLHVKLKDLNEAADNGEIRDSNLYVLAVLWHRFVRTLGPTLSELKFRPERQKYVSVARHLAPDSGMKGNIWLKDKWRTPLVWPGESYG
jgi:hypothetical protein